MKKINKIIIHCSDSLFGCALLINYWHRKRGFACIGYHYIIQNGYPYSTRDHIFILDGHIESGRRQTVQGAHCRGQNKNSIGICIIGKEQFSNPQKVSLKALVKENMHLYGLQASDVYCHNEFNKYKTCPGFSGKQLRDFIRNQGEL